MIGAATCSTTGLLLAWRHTRPTKPEGRACETRARALVGTDNDRRGEGRLSVGAELHTVEHGIRP